ncbi:MAG TPA: glycosyltransferase family 4 protein [Thermoanaerobaculia bacterium]|nr:glycosyltransferase family 4 protein [Thermoanaerobaculia bacterium]
MSDEKSIRRVALLGNHLPRQCGIATFTTDLSDAIAGIGPDLDCFVLAMNDGRHRHAYPGRVRFELGESDAGAYRRAADFLNVNAVDVISVQHEYGIFGGKGGSHLLPLLRELRMPIVTTLHTILATPNLHQRRVMDEITALSDRLVVMTAFGAELLREVHGVDPEKIDVIPHGIPNIPFNGSKNRLGVEGRPLILTFGLLSPDKGIEYVIDALPTILSHDPDVVYIVLGATHPHIIERHGETYRLMLEDRAKRLGVDGSVIFHNRFVSSAELSEFLAAADIYITPYLNPEQISSGTLAYALGAGKAVISTPYTYARELLAEGRGILVPWKDSSAIAGEIVGLLDHPEKCRDLRQRAAEHGRAMLWPSVAHSYLRTFERARGEHALRLHTAFRVSTLATRPAELPEVNLDHVRTMTDGTGILQHAMFNVPRYDEGYCLDDNARALLLMTLLEEGGSDDPRGVRTLASRYLAFVSHAFNAPLGRFRNFMSHSRVWREEQGSEDSHGRALWALGTVVGCSPDPGRHSLAGQMFHAALPAVSGFSSPRAWAFALMGIEQYLHAFEGDRHVQAAGRAIAERLLALFRRTDGPDWPWCESRVTYCNARLPQALIASGSWIGDAAMTATGLRSLEWLMTIQQTRDGYFAPVGTNGFFDRGTIAAAFDQQPVEACATVSACMQAFRSTGDHRWSEHARRAFTWFLGQNQLQQALYDPFSGGCRDALHADRLNENEGAESTLSFLLALMDMRADEVRSNAMQVPVAEPAAAVMAVSR